MKNDKIAFSCASSVTSAQTSPCTVEWLKSQMESERVKATIAKLRITEDSDERGRLKRQLPIIIPMAVIPEGKQRKESNVEALSGLVMTDFDHVSSDHDELLRIYKERIEPRIDELGIKMVFVSPSGDGIKILSILNKGGIAND